MVSTKLCRAAAAATQQLEFHPSSSVQRSKGFRNWLKQHGEHLYSLKLSSVAGLFAELPCRHLRQLSLEECDVQLGASSSEPGILSSLTELTQLQMNLCQVPRGALTALTAVPGLQHLELCGMQGAQSYYCGIQLPADVLQQLTQLTFLYLGDTVCPRAASLEHISSLQHLQQLWLDRQVLSPSSTPGLTQLTALTKVVLCDIQLDPAVLCGFTQLQHLELRWIIPLGAPDATPLLSVIGQQKQLRLLRLQTDQDIRPAAAAAYTALTASSQLQQLELVMSMNDAPSGVWQAVFRPALQLPDLQHCLIYPCCDFMPPVGTSHFSTADVGALASCCPGLQQLYFSLQPNVQLSALSQLTALTYLSMKHATAASVQSVAAITHLRRLYISSLPDVDKAALLPLTSLQRLTELEVEGGNAYGLWRNKSRDGDEPDVWRQLLEYCQQD